MVIKLKIVALSVRNTTRCSLPQGNQSKAADSCVYLVLTDRGVKLILALVSRSNAISGQAAISDLRASYEMMSASLENREIPTVL
jgi:hypothetical protein